MLDRTRIILIVVASGVIWALLTVANLLYAELNQDEGWYLYAARMVSEGAMPYRDFAFTQGPVFAWVYALFYPVVEMWGVAGGRVLTALIGLTATILASLLAARLTPAPWRSMAAVMTFSLLACNVYHNQYTLVVKTYSLCALFLTGGALCMTSSTASRTFNHWYALAGVLFALAAGVRISAGIVLPVVGVYLLWCIPRDQHAWWVFAVGGAAGLALAFGPSLLCAPEQTWFWLVSYHTAREMEWGLGTLLLKAGFISRITQAYFVLISLMSILVALVFISTRRWPVAFPVAGVLWVAALAVSFLHWAAPFPYEDYQVWVMPLIMALLASSCCSWLASRPGIDPALIKTIPVLLLIVTIASAFSSPINQSWVIRERDRIWWLFKDQPDLVRLQETGAWLRQHSGPDVVLLTQDTYLAIESGMRVPPGFEMGPFSYYPDWTDELAEQRNVLNRNTLLDLLDSTQAEWLAVSGYGFGIASPEIVPVPEDERIEMMQRIHARYTLVKEVEHFGQAHTLLRIYRLNSIP